MGREKPRLIRWGQVGSIVVVVFVAVFSGILLFGPEMSSYAVNGQQVSREEFQQYFLEHFAAFNLAIIISLILIAHGFWKEKAWSRHLAIFYWALGGFFLVALSGSAGLADLVSSLTFSILIPMGIAIWYFYVKQNVAEYYRAIAT